MTKEKLIKRLEDLRDNSESFITGELEHDEIWLDDIEALNICINIVKHLKIDGEIPDEWGLELIEELVCKYEK